MRTSSLWQFDERVGVGLSPETRSATEGRLFTTRAIAMQKGVGLVAAISGLVGAQPPESGLLRLGGDGRAACIQRIDPAYIDWPLPNLGRHQQAKPLPPGTHQPRPVHVRLVAQWLHGARRRYLAL